MYFWQHLQFVLMRFWLNSLLDLRRLVIHQCWVVQILSHDFFLEAVLVPPVVYAFVLGVPCNMYF